MPRYSVATTKDNLSSLIDKAMAGEEVIVTRHGKPTIAFRVVETPVEPDHAGATKRTRAEWATWLRERREAGPRMDISGADLVRQMRDEGQH